MNDDLKSLISGDETRDKGRFYRFLLDRVGVIVDKQESRDQTLFSVCSLLQDFVPAFDWVGFYLADPDGRKELVLGPFAGKPTEHVRIPFGRGICGQSAQSQMPIVVQDVSQEENYLSCSPEVKSEIVIPVMREGRFVAQLDIDSHLTAPFDDEDQAFLEEVCQRVRNLF